MILNTCKGYPQQTVPDSEFIYAIPLTFRQSANFGDSRAYAGPQYAKKNILHKLLKLLIISQIANNLRIGWSCNFGSRTRRNVSLAQAHPSHIPDPRIHRRLQLQVLNVAQNASDSRFAQLPSIGLRPLRG